MGWSGMGWDRKGRARTRWVWMGWQRVGAWGGTGWEHIFAPPSINRQLQHQVTQQQPPSSLGNRRARVGVPQ